MFFLRFVLTAVLVAVVVVEPEVAANSVGSWIQVGSDVNGEGSDDWFGMAIGISNNGNRIVIGAPSNDGNDYNAGHVRVYEKHIISNEWMQLGSDVDGEAFRDLSGRSVAISGDGTRIVVGAPYNDATGKNSGHVKVYDWNALASDWIQVGENVDGEAARDYSGTSVAITDNASRIVIGAPLNNNGAGHVRVYEWDDSISDWIQVGSDIDGEGTRDRFGQSVGISDNGNRILVGAPYFNNDENDSNKCGHARVYEWNETVSDWNQLGSDLYGEADIDYSGTAVSISGSGNRIVVGAPNDDGNGEENKISGDHMYGHVKVYEWDVDGLQGWIQVGPTLYGEALADGSGRSVGISSNGDRIVLGSPFYDGKNGSDNNSGQVRVYDWDGLEWNQVGTSLIGQAELYCLGSSVGISGNGNHIVVGAPIHDTSSVGTAGHVKVFRLGSVNEDDFPKNINNGHGKDTSEGSSNSNNIGSNLERFRFGDNNEEGPPHDINDELDSGPKAKVRHRNQERNRDSSAKQSPLQKDSGSERRLRSSPAASSQDITHSSR